MLEFEEKLRGFANLEQDFSRATEIKDKSGRGP